MIHQKLQDLPVVSFSDADARIVTLLAKGYSDVCIANILYITPPAVRSKISVICRRYSASSRWHLVAIYLYNLYFLKT